MPTYSFIVPVYKASPENFGKCIESIVRQGMADEEYEIIAIFDGKQENESALKQEAHFEKRSNLRFMIQEHSGVSAARNLGLKNSNGEWIVFVDSDDRLTPDAIKAFREAAVGTEPDIIFSNHFRQYGERNVPIQFFDKVVTFSPEQKVELLSAILSPGTDQGTVWGKAFHKNFIVKNNLNFNTELANGEDQEFMVRAATCSPAVVASPQNSYIYRCESDSTVRSFDSHYVERILTTMRAIESGMEADATFRNQQWIYERYCLDRLLLILTNYVFNNSSQWSQHQRRAKFKEILCMASFATALSHFRVTGSVSDFSLARRVTLFLAKLHFYSPIRLIFSVRSIKR